MAKGQVQAIAQKLVTYADLLQGQAQKLHSEVLYRIQSFATTRHDVLRSVECLRAVADARQYLQRKTRRVVVFLPLNRPVYFLVLWAIIPSLVAEKVHVRASQKTQPILRALVSYLQLEEFFPNIYAESGTWHDFTNELVTRADVTIFTGSDSEERRAHAARKKGSLFLCRGWGCNPIVVGPGADVEDAIRKIVPAKTFDSGQDDNGPDCILVHDSIAPRFLNDLEDEIDRIKVGNYSDQDVVVGPILDTTGLPRLASFLQQHSKDIANGGTIDFAKSIVHPTIIHACLSDSTNYERLSAPIFFVNTYDSDAELAKYFDDPRYRGNEMFISLFGASEYVNETESTILKEQNVLDLDSDDDGNSEYVGGASFVAKFGEPVRTPVHILEVISKHLQAAERASARRRRDSCASLESRSGLTEHE